MAQQTDRETADHLCPACGCLCDDLRVVCAGDGAVEVAPECPRAIKWFCEAGRFSVPTYERAGESVSRDEAVRAVVDLIQNSRRPSIVGLVSATIETQKVAATLAERTRSLVLIGEGSSRIFEAELLARQALGKVGATWGEVRRRADLIVYLGRPPDETHPRLVDRYLPPWVGATKTEGGAWCEVGPARWSQIRRGGSGPGATPESVSPEDVPSHREGSAPGARDRQISQNEVPFGARDLQARPNEEIAFLSAAATVVAGKELDADRFEGGTGVPARSIVDLADQLQNARYTAWILGAGFPRGPDTVGAWETLYALVNRLNTDGRRCVVVKAGGPGNASGAEAVFGWRAGFGQAIDFASGDPRYRPGEWSLERLWNGHGTDFVLGIGDPPSAQSFPNGLPKPSVPIVWLRPGCPASEAAAGFAADVQITIATPGWDESGTFVRSDGQPVPVRRIADPELPTAAEMIQELIDGWKERGG